MLDKAEVLDAVRRLLVARRSEAEKLDRIHAYWRGKQEYPILPANAPRDIKHLAQMSRVNMVKLVVDVLAQALFVDGFREPRAAANDAAVWAIWQANRMDARQIAVHRSTAAYGAAYTLVLPGDPHPVIRGVSPRRMTTLFDELDDEWPVYGLDAKTSGDRVDYRLYDDEAIYYLKDRFDRYRIGTTLELTDDVEFVGADEHGMGVCPVVRFLNTEDLDDDSCLLGEIEPLIPLQDQIDNTTFGLLVTQHFQAFLMRYVIGWEGADETQAIAQAASRMMVFEDPDIKVGEFSQASLDGYLGSRTSTTELLATLSQTPPHHMLGKLVNLSAEALVAAEVGQQRKVAERETTWGESWEQTLRLAASAEGVDVSDSAEVRWRDTEARSLAQTVDALGKIAQMLGVPVQELWPMIPGVSDQDIERWRTTASKQDALTSLTGMLERQMGGTPFDPNAA